ncbi:MAG: hypothetical protein JWO78_839 [Micavibrio sp.]|nr:hypothetical protein [Micavibrio sp.]
MRGYTFLLSFLTLPVLGAIGHDIYITYKDQDFDKTMMFSDVGYLWTHYHPDSFAWARTNLEPETWQHVITPVLEQSTILVSATPLILTAAVLAALKLLGLPPFREGGKMGRFKKGGFGFGSGDKKQGRFKYNRK